MKSDLEGEVKQHLANEIALAEKRGMKIKSRNIGMLRQWLNERTSDKRIVNEELETWLLDEENNFSAIAGNIAPLCDRKSPGIWAAHPASAAGRPLSLLLLDTRISSPRWVRHHQTMPTHRGSLEGRVHSSPQGDRGSVLRILDECPSPRTA